jgi:hypothetical protein
MSHVVNVIVLHSGLEAFRNPRRMVAVLNDYFKTEHETEHKVAFTEAGEDFEVGGDRGWEAKTYMAAINYLQTPNFLKYIEKIAWREPKKVLVLIQGQHDEQFSIYRFVDNKMTKLEY